jgi:hypothetical protein
MLLTVKCCGVKHRVLIRRGAVGFLDHPDVANVLVTQALGRPDQAEWAMIVD